MDNFQKLNNYLSKIEEINQNKNDSETLFYLKKIEEEIVNNKDFYEIFEILSQEYNKTYQVLALYKQISNIITSSNNFENFLKNLFKVIIFELNGESTSVMIYNNSNRKLEMLSYFNIKRGFKFVYGKEDKTTFKIGEGIAGKVAKYKEPIIVDQTNKSKDFIRKTDVEINSLICLPLQYNNELIGTLNLSHIDTSVYNEEHINILKLIASIISLKAVLYGYC